MCPLFNSASCIRHFGTHPFSSQRVETEERKMLFDLVKSTDLVKGLD